MEKILSIAVCSDPFSTSESEQLSNLRWLYDCLKNPLLRVTGAAPRLFSSNEQDGFSRKKFFGLSGIELDEKLVHFDFEADSISQESVEYFRRYVPESVLIVGYELSKRTRRLLDAHGFTFVDIWLHPVRFLDDILFGMSSNNRAVFGALSEFHYDSEHFYLYADRHKISTYKGYMRVAQNITIEPNSALLVGQTLQDKAVLKDGKFLCLLDYKDQLRQLSIDHKRIYFSRHPFERNDQHIIDYLMGLDNVEVTEIPSYSLLSKDEITTVAGISSSLLLEAKYFGKQVRYFYQPVFEISTTFGTNSYVSILQDLLYPQFWSKVLSPIMKVNSVIPVKFAVQKDKMRDMLGFYWSYKHVDKMEMMRSKLHAIDLKLSRLGKHPSEHAQAGKAAHSVRAPRRYSRPMIYDPNEVFKSIAQRVDEAEVISFDMFDTLVVRDLANPNDLFDIMGPKVEQITRGKIRSTDFRKIREEARGMVTSPPCGEEVSLAKRYGAIAKRAHLSPLQMNEIMDYEVDLETSLLRARPFVKRIYEYASSMRKRCIVVSDTFFSGEILGKILRSSGYMDFEFVWSSTDTGLLKHTGHIYPLVIKRLNIEPAKILHIGDSVHSDIEMAKRHGISTLHLPRPVDAFNAKTGLGKAFRFANSRTSSVITGLVSNKLMDNPLCFNYPSHSGGDRYLFGYSMIAPILYGFVAWILKKLATETVDKIYFLARDGGIVKTCYDILSKDLDNAPKSEYLYVSRRALSVPTIRTESDIEEIATINFSPISIRNILKNRFGLQSPKITRQQLRLYGFESLAQEISSSRDGNKFVQLCCGIKDQIYLQAKLERDSMIGYLHSKGLDGSAKSFVVDIGHNGTLQRRLSVLLETDNIIGLYFVTQKGIRTNVYDNGWEAYGYLANEINGSDLRHPYNKNILMFEACFSGEEGSTVRISSKDSGQEFGVIKLPTDREAERVEFIRETHRGVTDFVHDLFNLSRVMSLQCVVDRPIELQARESINPYLALLSHPYELDLMMFDKVSFENAYSGRDRRYLVYYNPRSRQESAERSIWKEHLEVLDWTAAAGFSNCDKALQGIIGRLVRLLNFIGMVDDRKYDKFRRSPFEFLRDSKNPVMRSFSKRFV